MTDSRMRILFLHTASILGGSERSFLDLLSLLNSDWRQNCVVVVPSDGPLINEIRRLAPEVKIKKIPFPPLMATTSRKFPLQAVFRTILALPLIFIFLWRHWRLLRSERINLIYSNGIKCHMFSLILVRLYRAKLIWHLQDYFPEFRFVRAFLKTSRNGPDAFVANSESVRHQFENLRPQTWTGKMLTVHNAVNPLEFSAAKDPGAKQIRVTIVGMLTPWKGQHVFLKAINEIYHDHKNVEFHLVGDEVYQTNGERGYKDQLIAFVREHQLEDRVVFTGFTKNVTEIYRQSEIIVHASTTPEPFGRVIIEAMCSECAVIATAGGGVLEIVEDGKNGLLVPMGESGAMARALNQLLRSPELRLTLGKNGRLSVLKRFSARTMAENIEALIGEV